MHLQPADVDLHGVDPGARVRRSGVVGTDKGSILHHQSAAADPHSAGAIAADIHNSLVGQKNVSTCLGADPAIGDGHRAGASKGREGDLAGFGSDRSGGDRDVAADQGERLAGRHA